MLLLQHKRSAMSIGTTALAFISTLGIANAIDDSDARPQYTYGHEIPVTCLERNMFVLSFILRASTSCPILCASPFFFPSFTS